MGFFSGSQFDRQALTDFGNLGSQAYQQGMGQRDINSILNQIQPGIEGTNSAIDQILQSNAPSQQKQTVLSELKARREDLLKEKLQQQKLENLPSESEVQDLLIRMGEDPKAAANFAQLYSISSVGGKTALVKVLTDKMQRGTLGGVEETSSPSVEGENLNQIDPVEQQSYEWPEINNFEGLTPTEKVKRQNELRKENREQLKDIRTKKKSVRDTSLRLRRLTQLNDSDKLPEGMERLNINYKTGELIVPAAANEQTQLYAKTLNDWITQAKDSFGARVTNFDLQAFLRRLPTLANTTAGRRLILRQMQILNEIDQLEADANMKVYKRYGLGNVDELQVADIAENLMGPDLDRLLNEFDEVINEQINFDEKKDINLIKENLEPGLVLMRSPDGEVGKVQESQIEEGIKRGYKLL